MPRVRLEAVFDYRAFEFKRALRDAVRKQLPEAEFNDTLLFRDFKRKVTAKLGSSLTVPDRCIED